MFTPCSAPKNCHLAMNIFVLLTTVSTLEELDYMVQSAAVVFSSSEADVEKISTIFRLGFKEVK